MQEDDRFLSIAHLLTFGCVPPTEPELGANKKRMNGKVELVGAIRKYIPRRLV